MDSLLAEFELMIFDGSERALRAMLGRERAERIEAQEKAQRLERERLVAVLERASEVRRAGGEDSSGTSGFSEGLELDPPAVPIRQRVVSELHRGVGREPPVSL